MVKLKCKNKKCKYEWDYRGENPFYACCPRCKGSVKIEDNNSNEKKSREDWERKF